MCVVCRTHKDKDLLLRVVKSPDGIVSVDTDGKAAGRGAYICKSPECIKKCQKTGILNRHLKSVVPQEIYYELTQKID